VIPITLAPELAAKLFSSGISARHGWQKVAQKFKTTISPLSEVLVTLEPSSEVRSKSGEWLPITTLSGSAVSLQLNKKRAKRQTHTFGHKGFIMHLLKLQNSAFRLLLRADKLKLEFQTTLMNSAVAVLAPSQFAQIGIFRMCPNLTSRRPQLDQQHPPPGPVRSLPA
jgi:hypothetical protein